MKKNFKLIIGFIIGIIISMVTIVTAQTIIKSDVVTYDNSKSKGSFSDVQNSLDELYAKTGFTEEEYHEEILHGADPVLSEELIPIYLADNGDVYYANTKTKWYEYATKRWANAVILVDDAYAKNREDNKDKYSVGDKIDEQDIESYFVWIPRYAYKLWNLDSQEGILDAGTLNNKDYASSASQLTENYRIIEIVFGTNSYLQNTKLDGKQSAKSLIRDNTTGAFSEPEDLAVNNYLQHPAFTLGETSLNGFWMGKFETGYNQTNTGESAITDIEDWNSNAAIANSVASNKIVVKPNVFSWRFISVSNIFDTSKGYNPDLKSHMLKNTEWGAVAYLSHSAYGKGGEININNTNDYKTGYSAAAGTNQTSVNGDNDSSTSDVNDKYNSSIGYQASTTGNITGVYDMSGGTLEYVAGTIISGRTTDATSGFTPETITAEMKAGYIDVYPADSSAASYNKRILGDATGEMAPFYSYLENSGNEFAYWHSSWYSDYADFADVNYPWFHRGRSYIDGALAGQFSFSRTTGGNSYLISFRLALAPASA